MFFWGSKRNSEAEIFISVLDAHKYAAYFEAQTLLRDKNSIEKSILMMVDRMFLIRELWPDLSFREVRGLILILVRSACADILEEEKGTAPLDMDEIIPGKWESSEETMDFYAEPLSWSMLMDHGEQLSPKLMDTVLLRYHFGFSFETMAQLLHITPEAASYRLKKMSQQVVSGVDLSTLSKEPVPGWVYVQEAGRKFLEGILLRQWESRQKRPSPMEKIYLSARFESRVLRHIRHLFKGKEVVRKEKGKLVFWVWGIALVLLILAGSWFWRLGCMREEEGPCLRGCFLRVCHFLGWEDAEIQRDLLRQYMPQELPRGMEKRKESFLKGCRWVTFSDGHREVLLGEQRKAFHPPEFLVGGYVSEEILIQDQEAQLFTGEKANLLCWQKEGIYFCLLSEVDPADLMGIAQSVVKEK